MTVYDQGFFAGQRDGSRRSAEVVLPRVFELVGTPGSMLDVGCGVGTWLAVAGALGVPNTKGVDGTYVVRSELQIPEERFAAEDLTKPVSLGERFDLVMSLEVAEHLDESRADVFVDTLAEHGDVVLFSAAVPNQGGTHHVNEQWPSYWTPKFRAKGFRLFDVIRPLIWDESDVEFWYRQNFLLFARDGRAEEIAARIENARLTAMPVLDVAHPELVVARADTAARLRATPVWRLAAQRSRRRLRQMTTRR